MAFVVNHYELLQLPINATTEQIKAAYNERWSMLRLQWQSNIKLHIIY